MTADELSEEEITAYLTKFSDSLTKLTQELEKFVQEKGIGKFLSEDESWLVGSYFGFWMELIKHLQMSSYDELRVKLEQFSNSGNPYIQSAMDKFWAVEQNWEALIASMEARHQYLEKMKRGLLSSAPPVVNGQQNGLDKNNLQGLILQKVDKKSPVDVFVSLGDICKKVRWTWVIFTGNLSWPSCKAHTRAVAEIRSTLKELGCQVIVVHFGSNKRAHDWKTDIKCPFQQYLDQSRTLYHSLGMVRSVAKTWHPETTKYIINHILAGNHVEFTHDEFDDVIQLGGDVVFDKNVNTIWKCPSETATDRPNPQNIIQLLADYEGQRLAKCGCTKFV